MSLGLLKNNSFEGLLLFLSLLKVLQTERRGQIKEGVQHRKKIWKVETFQLNLYIFRQQSSYSLKTKESFLQVEKWISSDGGQAATRRLVLVWLLEIVCLFVYWGLPDNNVKRCDVRTRQCGWTVFTLSGPGFFPPPVSTMRWRAERKCERGGGTQISDTSPTFGSEPTAPIRRRAARCAKTPTTASREHVPRFHAATGWGEIHENLRRRWAKHPMKRPGRDMVNWHVWTRPRVSIQMDRLRPLNYSS